MNILVFVAALALLAGGGIAIDRLTGTTRAERCVVYQEKLTGVQDEIRVLEAVLPESPELDKLRQDVTKLQERIELACGLLTAE